MNVKKRIHPWREMPARGENIRFLGDGVTVASTGFGSSLKERMRATEFETSRATEEAVAPRGKSVGIG